MNWWRRVYIRDNYRCQYCGRNLMVDLDSWLSIELDHLRSTATGGTNDIENYVTACNVCNRLKGKWMPDGHESLTREDLLAQARRYVFERRAAWASEYLSAVKEFNAVGESTVILSPGET